MTGICQIPLIPCRSEPSDRSEMVNQLLFGETYELVEAEEKWLKVKTHGDNYECWISRNQHSEKKGQRAQKYIVDQKFAPAFYKDEAIFLPAGSIVEDPRSIQIGEKNFILENEIQGRTPEDLEKFAKSFLNAPYLWGGKTFMGIDCSGYSQVLFRCMGIAIPRDAWQQEEKGSKIEYGEHKLGDLAFFSNEEGKVTHVGLIIQKNEIIHASGKVRIDTFGERGISNSDSGIQTHQLFSVKRYF